MKPNRPTWNPLRHVLSHSSLLPLLMTAGLVISAQANDQKIEPEPAVTIRFSENSAVISGVVADPQTASLLIEAIRDAQTGCLVQSERLVVDLSASPLPAVADIRGILMELALSTHEGTLQIDKDSVSIRGVTDSLVAHSAFQTRIEHLAGERHFRIYNGIEVVSTAELSARALEIRGPQLAVETQDLPQLAERD